jgi:hypothetical protein
MTIRLSALLLVVLPAVAAVTPADLDEEGQR